MSVAIYARVSTAEQAANGYSIDEQLSRMRKYCDAMHWTIYKEYVDAGFSGGNMDRPALQNLLRDLDKIDRVLVYKLDRLSRSQKDTLYLIEDQFIKNKIGFVSMTESLDTTSPFGIAMIGVLAVFAQLEKEQIRERMEMGRVARAKEGKYVGQSRTPIGYEYHDGELKPNPSEAEQVREVFNLCLAGKSYREIAAIMNKQGFSHRYGKWKAPTVPLILQNPVYTGKVAFKKQLYDGAHDPIVSQEVFDQAQRIVQKRTDLYAHQHNAGKAKSYLGGLLVCAKCGAKYYRRSYRRGVPRYVCLNRLAGSEFPCDAPTYRCDEIDKIVLDQVASLSVDELAIKRREKKTVSTSAEIAKIDEQLSRLIDLYSLGTIPVSTIQQKIADLNTRRASLESVKEEPQTDVVPLIRSFQDVISSGSLEQVRAILFELIEKVELDGDDVRIYWKF